MTTLKHVSETSPFQGRMPTGAETDFNGSLMAIRRAAVRARQLAEQTGTDLIVVRSGQLVRVPSRQKAMVPPVQTDVSNDVADGKAT